MKIVTLCSARRTRVPIKMIILKPYFKKKRNILSFLRIFWQTKSNTIESPSETCSHDLFCGRIYLFPRKYIIIVRNTVYRGGISLSCSSICVTGNMEIVHMTTVKAFYYQTIIGHLSTVLYMCQFSYSIRKSNYVPVLGLINASLPFWWNPFKICNSVLGIFSLF